MTDGRRALPSVSALLERDAIRELLEQAPRPLVVDAIRTAVDAARAGTHVPTSEVEWAQAVSDALARSRRPSLRRVINATGVVLHTNLGRAPLALSAVQAMQGVATHYANLEYDIERGARGSRYSHCVTLLRELTGAEDALVVNNNAAALVLTLNTFANGRDAVISRGELVEIGGSFRIPDIMARSGARLVEVGTTNRTHADDYARALKNADAVGAILKVHRSNFAMEGFVAEVDARALAQLGAAHGIPVIHDLGSGLLIPLDDLGLKGEPTAMDAVRAGAALVTMSGDKLLGGPQAGIIVGDAQRVKAVRENPLTRALRVDKLTLAALEATLMLYREPDRARREIPVLAMLSAPIETLRTRARAVKQNIGATIDVIDSDASVGGGAFPNATIPSVALALPAAANDRVAQDIEARLRLGDPAVIGRVSEGRLLVDLRTIQPDDDDQLVAALRAALAS